MGVGVSTFVYVRGGSYLTDKPKACVYCHVMREQSAGWIKAAPVR
jgi:cytochrome c nitrite reductase small subunit